MGKRMGLVVVGIALLAAPITAAAQSPWANEVSYADQACGKLKYGLKNALLGWTSIIRDPIKANENGENFFVGLGRGVINGVGQTVGGVLHAVTFPITQIDVPLPAGGTDVFE